MLFDILDILNVSKEEFFSYEPEKYESDKRFIMKFRNLSKENQELIYNIMESLKWFTWQSLTSSDKITTRSNSWKEF